MRIPLILAIVLLILQLAIDTYLFFAVRRRFKRPAAAKIQLYESLFFVIYVIVIFFSPARTSASEGGLTTLMWMVFFYLTVYIAKAVFVVFDLIASVPKLFGKPRLKRLSCCGAAAAALTVLIMLWGAMVNRYRLDIKHVDIDIAELPASFNDYRIAQISDLHLGTFGTDTTFVSKLVDSVNALRPNLIVFTGDIVNQRADEAEPFISVLSRLHAPDGVFSILGNHDYGDYVKWASETDREANIERIFDQQIEMGWELLTNSSEIIRGAEPGDSLVIVGVANWGEPPFGRYGDINAAYPTSGDPAVKILLTHNPRHWTDEVARIDTLRYALTLSGHTHAMQFEVFGLSPAALRYPGCWAGLYEAPDGRKLYVNIGAGCVGMPIRIGATPEITLFTLKKSSRK